MISNDFLPISKEDMKRQGIEQLDFVYVIADAYVDHPSFGHAIISRVIQARLYRRNYFPAGLERGYQYFDFGRTKACFYCQWREYGSYGKSLHGGKEETAQ